MLRTQSKIFLRSPLRAGLLLLLFGGSFYYYGPALLKFIQGEAYYAGGGMLQNQLRDFIYPFLLILFLSFDSFREVPDADLNETLKPSRSYLRQDLIQALLMLLVVLAYALLFLGIHLACRLSEGVCTMQVVGYYIRLTGMYYVLNGMVAVLAGWFFARNSGKIVGYIELIAFALLVSPLMNTKLEMYSYRFRWLSNVSQVLLLMPQGTISCGEYSKFAVNWTIAARGFFWLGVFGMALLGYYLRYEKRLWCSLGMLAGAGCAVWGLIYSGLPASYYCVSDFILDSDDDWRYMIEKVEQKEREADFRMLSYNMKLKFGRQLQAEVTCVPSEQKLEEYALTLYRMYEVDSVTDEKGEELPYQREENTLLIYGQADGIEAFTVRYHGGPYGDSNIYNNRDAIHLPGWFPYYPVPGWNQVYGEVEGERTYIDNRLEKEAEFRIQIEGIKEVYSDLDMEHLKGLEFYGMSDGPTLLAGFVGEYELENGTIYIYPQLNYWDWIGTVQDNVERVTEEIEREGNQIKLIMQTSNIPTGEPGTYKEDRIIDSVTFILLDTTYKRSGQFNWRKAVEKTSEEERIATVKALYYNFKENDSGEGFYDRVLDMYKTQMREFGYEKKDFEAFVVENLGQEEWDYLKEVQENVTD